MEIPLRLVARKDGTLFYGVSLLYRFVIGGMLILLGAAIVLEEFHAGPLGWIAIFLLLLGLIYKEDWLFDPHAKTVSGLVGFYPLLKKTHITFEEIGYIQLAAFSKGTVPGSKEEKSSNRDAFESMQGKSSREGFKASFDFARRKKLYIALLLITKNKEQYLLDMTPAQRATRLAQAGKALAALIGCSFLDNIAE